MSNPAAPVLHEQDLRDIFAQSPLMSSMGVQVIEMDHEAMRLVMRLPLQAHFERRPRGGRQFHGGILAALIDMAGDFAVGMCVGGGVPTMNLRVDYLRPAVGDHMDAIAVVRRLGRSTAVADVDVLDPEGRLVAIGRGTFVPKPG